MKQNLIPSFPQGLWSNFMKVNWMHHIISADGEVACSKGSRICGGRQMLSINTQWPTQLSQRESPSTGGREALKRAERQFNLCICWIEEENTSMNGNERAHFRSRIFIMIIKCSLIDIWKTFILLFLICVDVRKIPLFFSPVWFGLNASWDQHFL